MKIIGILIAAVVAIAATYLAYSILSDQNGSNQVVVQTEGQGVKTANVLVAAQDIDLGDVLTPEMLESKEWPEHLVIEGFVTTGEQSQSVVGRVARATIVKGEPVNMNKLSNPEDPGFIAANLPEGMRMATISSDAVAGLAGFVFPGDRVDVIVTRKYPLPPEIKNETGVNDTSITETLVTNVRVLAVNQRATLEQNTENSARGDRDRIPSSISLEVTPEDAHKLRLAQETGYVSLALRSLKDKETPTDAIFITEPDITLVDEKGTLMEQNEKDKETGMVSVVRGTQREELEVPAVVEEEEMVNEYSDESGE